MLCRRTAKARDRYALYLCSRMNIVSYCFLCLVQDAPALLICRVFVATATVLPGVKALEHGVPLTPRCHTISTFVLYMRDRLSVTVIPAADLPNCSPCVYNTRKSAELRTGNTGIDGMDH